VLKAFASWLYREGYTDDNLLQRCRLPKARRIEPEWLTQKEIERLLGAFDRKAAMGARLRHRANVPRYRASLRRAVQPNAA